jgi:hypothetical protein
MNAKSYAVRHEIFGGGPSVAITAAAFDAAFAAQTALIDRLEVEEAYAILVQNYVDLELCILAIVVDDIVGHIDDPGAVYAARRKANRSIANLLSSARLFRDHLAASTARLVRRKHTDVLTKLDNALDKAGAAFEYRAMEALRNHVQHHGLPIDTVTFHSTWVDTKEEKHGRLQHRFAVGLRPESLASDRKVPPELIDELRARADEKGRVEIVPLLRGFVSALAELNQCMRDVFADLEKGWFAALADVIEEYEAEQGPGERHSLTAFEEVDGERARDIALRIGLQERLETLRRQNRKLPNLHRREIVG